VGKEEHHCGLARRADPVRSQVRLLAQSDRAVVKAVAFACPQGPALRNYRRAEPGFVRCRGLLERPSSPLMSGRSCRKSQ
jgi:hypothetical protein